jgi:pectate lyase
MEASNRHHPARAILLVLLMVSMLHAGPVGFASLKGGTDGGGYAEPVLVRTAEELQRAAERLDEKKDERDSKPRVIRLAGDIDLGELANERPGKVLKRVGVVRPRSNTTLEGPPGGATLRGGTIELKGAENVIIRNLRFRDLWEDDPSGDYDEMGWDYIRISSAGKKGSRRVWVDHCDFGKVYDGQLDIIHGSDLVTVSHCVFSGGGETQKKGMLIGNSSSASARDQDKGHLNVTIHDCWFKDLASRAPRLRHGNVHFLNNLVEDTGTATISVCGGATLVEGCVYKDCKVAVSSSHADDSREKGRGGLTRIADSVNIGRKTSPMPDDGASFRFNAIEGFAWDDLSVLPYPYQAAPASEVEAKVKRDAGPK